MVILKDEAHAMSFARALDERGWSVDFAPTDADLVLLATKPVPDLIVTDHLMAVTAVRLKATPRIIFLSEFPAEAGFAWRLGVECVACRDKAPGDILDHFFDRT